MIHRTFRDCKIQEKIAVGGFGTVYKAVDVKLNVPRAIKIFHPHLSEEKGFRKRFESEMRLLAYLDHPGIVRIMSAIDEPDVSGFIMEFVEGDTLSDILENSGALTIPEAIDIFTQVAKAIAYAHNLENQIIHRDLSPDNIMLRPDNIVKIMDFGIAKTIGSERVTQTGIVLGKPTYMAPEQFEGTVSIYTDQYALGIILFEMVTGRVPFDAESPIALYKLHLNEPLIPPRELNDQVPPNMEKVLNKALAKDEKDRYKNVDEMLEALLSEGKGGRSIDNRLASLMLDVNRAIDRENYERALELLQEILSYEPDNKEALARREEVQRLQKAQHDQELIEEWFEQARVFYQSDLNEEACGCLVDLLKIARHYGSMPVVKEYQSRLRKEMPELFQEALAIAEQDWKKVKEHTHKGKNLFQQDRFEDALSYFEKALLINPYSETLQKLKNLTQKKIKRAKIATYYKDGIIAIKNEDYRKALDCFKIIIELNPQHKEAKKYREMAENELERLQKSRSQVEATYREALELYEKWEFTLAMAKFERVLELDESHRDAKLLLTESKARLDDENKLEEIGFFYNQGRTFYKSQQWEKAITCFNRVLKYMENHKGALEYRELAIQKQQQQVKIDQAFGEALDCFRNSEYTKALQKIDFILDQDKNHKGAKQYKALCEELRGLGDEVPSSGTDNQ